MPNAFTNLAKLTGLAILIFVITNFVVILRTFKSTHLNFLMLFRVTTSSMAHVSSLDLSYNNLALSPSSLVNYTFPMLESLRLPSCNLTEFPIFLKDSKLVEEIDLSNNKTHGQVPERFLGLENGALTYLNISHNFLTNFSHFPWNALDILDLHSNSLPGSLPVVLPSTYLFLSKQVFRRDSSLIL